MKNFKEYVLNRDMKIAIKKDNTSIRNKIDKLVPKEQVFMHFNARQMLNSDIKDLLEIDEFLNKDDIEKYLKETTNTSWVLEAANSTLNKVVGFVIFKTNLQVIEILILRYVLRYENQFFDKLVKKIIDKLDNDINKIYMIDNQSNHPSFYAKLKDYGFYGRKTNAGWEFTYEQTSH